MEASLSRDNRTTIKKNPESETVMRSWTGAPLMLTPAIKSNVSDQTAESLAAVWLLGNLFRAR